MPYRVQQRPVTKAASRGRKSRSSKKVEAIAEAIAAPATPTATFETLPTEIKGMIYRLLIPKGLVTPWWEHRPVLPRRIRSFCLANKAIYRDVIGTYYAQKTIIFHHEIGFEVLRSLERMPALRRLELRIGPTYPGLLRDLRLLEQC